MATIEIISKYFPSLTNLQKERFEALEDLYREWNSKINVISRKDIDELYLHHVLHSLGIAKLIAFKPMSIVLDVGTGGGFPGIPLSILFEEVEFHLIDSIGKKITVVQAVADALSLKNVQAEQKRAEQMPNASYDFVLSRAVTHSLPFYEWVQSKFSRNQYNDLGNGILHLKGGDLKQELLELRRKHKVYPLNNYFEEPYFETKKIVYIPRF